MARKNTAVAKAQPAKPTPPANLGDMVTALLSRPDLDMALIERAERLLNLHRQQIFAEAMVAAQMEIEPIFKDAKSEKGKYASFEAIDRAIRPIYSKHGFALSFGTTDCPYPDRLRVTVTTYHNCGLSKIDFVDMPIVTKGPKGNDVMTPTHATMSALSYAKRGLETMVFNIVTTEDRQFDDDGNGGADFLTADEVKYLKAELEKVGVTTPEALTAFLEYIEAESFETIRATQVDKINAAIRAKARAMTAGKTEPAPGESGGNSVSGE